MTPDYIENEGVVRVRDAGLDKHVLCLVIAVGFLQLATRRGYMFERGH